MRIAALLVLLLVAPASAAEQLDEQVASILIKRCLECHKGSAPSGGLSLETRAGLLQGGESGSAITPGDPDDSYLLDRINGGDMPPAVKGIPQELPAAEREILTRWIADGAHWPEDRTLDLYEVTTDVRGGRDWWAFQPVQRPEIPQVRNTDRVRNPIDQFVLARLEQKQLQPAPVADNHTLIRRLYIDVTGLPPSFEELEAWDQRLNDPQTRARQMSQLVQQLLDSPHFGERWARYWLDLVRYAESSGYERDQPKAFAWKYRDWVVNAINSDMPVNEFILHQLAGDEIDQADEQSHIATGFLRLGTWNDEPNDPEDYKYERLEDMVHVTSSAFLGLTVKCARCHDHKFDPIPQDDYYRMASVFWSGPIHARSSQYLGGPSAEELGYDNLLGWTDITKTPSPLHVLKNGERHRPLHEITPGPLTLSARLFADFTAAPEGADTTRRRRQLAEWIIRDDNPLTARVFVNRLWQQHFGEGLIRSPNNFGFKGAPPTHPRLLDWLAAELVEHNWSARHIHELILNSATWQQSSLHPEAEQYAELDSGNHLLWRAGRRRLDAETLRDSLLSASGEIDLSRIGGEGFKPTFSKEALEGLSRKGSGRQAADAAEQRRRSLYIYVSRSLMPPMMTTFDQCDTTLPCGQRDITTSPTQALAMMNNHFVHQRSEALANRVEQDTDSPTQQIKTVWKHVLGRLPTNQEQSLALQHLQRQQARFEQQDQQTPTQSDEPQPVQLADLPDPVLHLTADTGVTTTSSGQVTAWQSSAGEHHARQDNAEQQPQLIRDAINGHAAVRFDGNRRFLHVTGDLLQQADCTILAVATDTATTTGLREIISNWHREKNIGTSVFLGCRDTNTVRFSDQYTSAGMIRDRQQPFLLTARNSDEGATIWQSRLVLASRDQPLSNRRFGTKWVIGQQGNINGEYWHGDIAELYVFDRPLADHELSTLWQHLISKYDLTDYPPAATDQAKPINRSPAHRSLASLCHVLLNSNEFLYVD